METKKNIWKKLMEIQKAIKTFATSEEAAKRDSRGRSEYRFTPGWTIVESIREQMDQRGLMLMMEVTNQSSRDIEYPVYKMINGSPMTFNKKEVYVTVEAKFTWVDTETDEKEGPFTMVGAGANGTDKSCASAIAYAERYFLLKFFHITTHETSDEPDAHDSSELPGIPSDAQPQNAKPMQPAMQPGPQQAVVCPITQGPVTMAPQGGQPQMPPQGQAPFQGSFPPPPAYGQKKAAPAPGGTAFDLNTPAVKEAVTALMYFEKGTPSHQQMLNEIIGKLCNAGLPAYDESFVGKLTDAAQAFREGRTPNA